MIKRMTETERDTLARAAAELKALSVAMERAEAVLGTNGELTKIAAAAESAAEWVRGLRAAGYWVGDD